MPRKLPTSTHRRDAEVVGSRLRQALSRSGITATELARRAGVQRTSLGRLLAGERGMGTAGLLAVLVEAALAGVDLNYVFAGSRAVIIDAETPELAQQLRILADRLSLQLSHGQAHPGGTSRNKPRKT